jgi:hypothetical protein
VTLQLRINADPARTVDVFDAVNETLRALALDDAVLDTDDRGWTWDSTLRDDIVVAALELADSDIFGANEGWSHFTCSEVAVVEKFLRACTRNRAADALIESHADGDDDPADAHHAMYLEGR